MTKATIFTFLLIMGAAVGLVWLARPTASPSGLTSSTQTASIGLLAAEENKFDFGSISMAAGKVKHSFKVKNTGSEPVMLEKMYTSCMCTVASLMMGEKQFGPYGMPGHGFIPKINQKIGPGEVVAVEAIFDPAAHGPAGIGPVERIVTLETDAGGRLELSFSATVAP